MKKKFGLWLNIVTICLCVCAIAIGVYAATSATLTVSGQIGFTAHGCSVKIINYTIENSSRTQGATAISDPFSDYIASGTTYTAFPEAGIEVSGTTVVPFNMGKFYFVDDLTLNKVPDITITFNIHNTSAYPVTASMTESISKTYDDITVVGGTWTKTFGANDNATGGYDENTLSITLRLANPDTADFSSITEVSQMLSVTFNKDVGAHAEGELYVENGRLYVEYGNYPAVEPENVIMYGDYLCKPIRWVAVQDLASNSTLDLTGLTAVPETGDFYFVSVFAFDKQKFNSVGDAPVDGKNPNDYATSDVRKYLAGDFVDKYSLNNLVANATARTLETETITETTANTQFIAGATDGTYHSGYAIGYITNGSATAMSDCSDKLWLMSSSDRTAAVNVLGGSTVGVYPAQKDNLSADFVEGVDYILRSSDYMYYQIKNVPYIGGQTIANVTDAQALRPGFQMAV